MDVTGGGTRAGVATLVVLAAVAPALGAASAGAAVGDAGPRAVEPPGFGQLDFDPDATVIRIDVAANGTARWSVHYRLDLGSENETAAFRALQEDIRSNRSVYLDDFASGIHSTVADAANATGRQMAARNFSVRTSYDSIQGTGHVLYRFTWTNFAAESGDRIVVGDVLAGFFLDSETRLVISWPQAYELRSVDPPAEATGNSVRWAGGTVTFDANGPRVVVARGGGGAPIPLLVAVAAVAAVAVAGGALYWRRRGDAEEAATPDATAETETAEPEPELLSNEERVLQLLEERGGRVKQQEIVSEFDWTAAKTSQVVNAMQEEGKIEKFRLGRENVVKLPEEDVGGDRP